MDSHKGEPTGAYRDTRHIEGGKGGDKQTGAEAEVMGPRRGTLGAKRDTV